MRAVSAEPEDQDGTRAPGTGREHRPLDAWLLVGTSVLLALPYLLMSHVNTVDGPAHVLGGAILGPLRNVPAVAAHYEAPFTWGPNALMQYMLAALDLVVGPTWAEKLLVAGYVVGLPLAFRFAVRSVDGGAGWLALGILPLEVNRPLLEGFYSFSYGFLGAVVAIGIVLRARPRWRPGTTAGLATVLVLVFLEHPLPLVIALAVIVCLAVADARNATRSTREGRDPAGTRRRLLAPLAAIAPSVGMTVWFVLSGNAGGNFARYLSPASLVGGLLGLGLPLKAYSDLELAASVLTAAVIAGLFVAGRSAGAVPPGRRAGLVSAAVCCGLAYVLVPNDLGVEAVISPRTAVFVPVALLLLLAGLGIGSRAAKVAGVSFVACALLLTGVRLPTQLRNDRLVGEFLSVERAIPRGATIFEVRYRSYGNLDPLTHEASRVAADLGGVDLGDIEVPGPDYQERLRPPWTGLDRLVRRGDLAGYLAAGGRLDYVIAVTAAAGLPEPATAPPASFEAALRRHFAPVLATRTGLVELYRRR